MPRSNRWLVPLCLVSHLWAFSFGVNAPLASLWMQAAGCGDSLIGLNTGTYYLGIALAAGVLPWLLSRFGPAPLLAGMLGSAVTAAAFPWGGGPAGWFGLRLANGVAAALSLIPLETYVNRSSAPDRRAWNFGLYAVCIASGVALGNLVALQMAASRPRLAFLAGGAAALAASGVVAWWRPAVPPGGGEGRAAPRLAGNFLAFGSGWSQGFLEGCMVALLPIYLLSGGLSEGVASWLMGGLVLGATLAQAPVAWLADRLGRAAVLAACNLVALLGVCCLLWTGGVVWLACWLFAVGACSGAFYPLGLALLGERTPPEAMSRAGSWFLAINCLGSVAGPVVAGAAMERFGRAALVVTCGGAVGLVLTSWLLLGVCRRALPAAPARPALKDAA